MASNTHTSKSKRIKSNKFSPTYLPLFFFLADGVDLFQGDIVMTGDIRNSLRSRGVLVPGDDPSRLLPQGWGAKLQKRPKRAIMNTRRTDLRWPRGQVPYEITASNCKCFFFLSFFFISIGSVFWRSPLDLHLAETRAIGHFTVVSLVTWLLSGSEAGVDLFWYKPCFFSYAKHVVPMLTSLRLHIKSRRVCIKTRSTPA